MDRREHNRLYRQRHKKKIKRHKQQHYKTTRGCLSRIVSYIKQRCNNPKATGYKHYGGKGIKICFTVNELYQWIVINNIKPQSKHIHRLDNNSDYRLDNIEFLSPKNHLTRQKHKRDTLGRFC